MGLISYLTNMLQAIHSTATSTIVIQERTTHPIQLIRLVWQGCPLLPLLYIVAAHASDQGLIQGVFLIETGE